MKDSIQKRKKKLLALCLSVMMFSSVAALAACKDADSSTDSSSSSSTTEEVKDDGLIKNAGFETFDDDNALNTSVTGWTKATTSISGSNALSSKAASGIIDLETDAWHNLTGSNVDVSTLSEADAEAKWSEMTVKDKLAYYDLWKEKNADKTISDELDFYETLNIDSGDIPTVEKFDTHDSAVANKGDDTKVLMIHNQYPEEVSSNVYKALGTGQQFTSSSTVTVKAGTSAEFSVWVKTANLQSSATDGSVQEAVEKGAFISVTHSVGGKTLDAYKVENINTKDVTENNGWKQYSFLLKGSSYADTTFSLVLGLGQGSMNYRGEYVNGYAFFDDIECNVISNAEYEEKVTERGIVDSEVVNFHHEGKDKIVNATKGRTKFALDFFGDFSTLNLLSAIDVAPTETDGYTSVTAPWVNDGKGTDATNDVTKVFENAEKIAAGEGLTDGQKAELTNVYEKYLKEDTTFADKQTLLLMSVGGTAYTAKDNTALQFSDPNFYLEGEQTDYLAISFFVKTSKMAGYTGAGVTLVDGKNKTSFESIDTTTVTAVTVNDEKIYGDWQQYFFFVKNDAKEGEKANTSFTLEFTFGPTSIAADADINKYYAGFAAFTNFSVLPLSKAEYDSAQEGDYAKLVSVGQGDEETLSETPFDEAQATPTTALEEGLARPQNYMGVYFNSAYLTGSGSTEINVSPNAGLISKEYFTADDGYFTQALDYYTTNGNWQEATPAWLKALAGSDPTTVDPKTVWNNVFGNSTQPLLIYNAEAEESAYGYISTSKQLAVNTYTAISVRVRGEGAAYVRLVDTNASNYTDFKAYNQTLSIGGYLTFWYNDDGNICTGDPEDKATQVAFKLQPNGLYKANKRGWDGYKDLANKDAWYANLSAYTETDENGNKLVAKGGATHDYDDYWNNAGMNGIAFYYDKANDRYCADEDLKVPVLDLATEASDLKRTGNEDANKYKLEAEIPASELKKDEWTKITFYVHTGDKVKDYRLEVFSGDKEGKPNAQGSYLVVDTNAPDASETTFNGLIEEYEDTAATKFESVFSYFDTASYLRYNKDLDKKGYGNLYEDNYTPSAQKEGVAYLANKKGNYVEIFADYQYSEKTVTASAVEEEAEEESDSSSDDEGTNVWLLISSLSVAGVLILAVVSILIRKVFLKGRKNRVKEVKEKKVKKAKKDKKSKK